MLVDQTEVANGKDPRAVPKTHRLMRRTRRFVPQRCKPRLGQRGPQYAPQELTVPRGYGKVPIPQPAPSISIVTPSLNSEAFIERTIESVAAQRYPALEHIVMDGGSRDATLEIVDRHRDHIAHVASCPDDGPASAINAGFARSGGEIMGWLSSDDVLLPGALSYVARFFAHHPEVDLVYGYRIVLDDRDRDIGIWVTPKHSVDMLRWFDYLPQEAAFWRRGLWEEHGGIDERFTVAFDWDLFLRFQAAGARIVRLPRFIGGFRYHAAQRSEAQWDHAALELDEIRSGWHGRKVSVAEAQSQVDLIRLRSVPSYVRHRLARRIGTGRTPVFLSCPKGEIGRRRFDPAAEDLHDPGEPAAPEVTSLPRV